MADKNCYPEFLEIIFKKVKGFESLGAVFEPVGVRGWRLPFRSLRQATVMLQFIRKIKVWFFPLTPEGTVRPVRFDDFAKQNPQSLDQLDILPFF